MRCRHLIVISVLAAMPLHNIAKPLTPRWDDVRVKHTWNTVPHNWETLGHPPADTVIDLHVALKPQHEDALIDALYAVSDPRSPKYGAHLSKKQVAQLVEPHPYTLELISTWLVENHNIPSSSISTSHGGGWLTVTGVPVFEANEMLGASYQLYRRTGTNDTTILRTIGYALPAILHAHVQTIVPTTSFASMSSLSQTPWRLTVEATMDTASKPPLMNPSELRTLYKTITYNPTQMARNLLGVAGFNREFSSDADLTKFMTAQREDAVDATYEVKRVNGGWYDQSDPATEPSLNMQYAQAIAYPTPHIFYSTGGIALILKNNQPAGHDMFLAWLNYMTNSETKLPQTVSIPYGAPEQNFPREYTKTLCDLFAKLGARGVSIIFASGSDGVGKGGCKDKDDLVQFIPEFPSSCPFVTSVGGTWGVDPEIVANLSGGGFSNHFPLPPYQRDKVPIFLEGLRGKYDGWYNDTGRGIPDIAAQSLNYFIIKGKKAKAVSGTSCAVPTVAGIISLLNDYQLSKDRRPLGFLNPWLYSIDSKGFNDITSGSNPGCGTTGFEATKGWDPVTGLGTPDFVALQEMLPLFPVGQPELEG